MQSEKRHCLNFFTPFCPAVGGLSENISYFCITMDIYDVKILSDRTEGTMRKIAVATCRAVCSVQINIILESDVIRSVAFEGGCQGNLLGIGALCQDEGGRCHCSPARYRLWRQAYQLSRPTCPRTCPCSRNGIILSYNSCAYYDGHSCLSRHRFMPINCGLSGYEDEIFCEKLP